jgi:hypothetical protein
MFDTLEMDESDKVLFSIGPGFSSIPDIIPCIIILHFLRNDLEQEVTKFMMHNHHGTNINYTRNILLNMYYML